VLDGSKEPSFESVRKSSIKEIRGKEAIQIGWSAGEREENKNGRLEGSDTDIHLGVHGEITILALDTNRSPSRGGRK